MKRGLLPKGERLKWVSLNETTPMKLTGAMLTGKRLTEKELKSRRALNDSPQSTILVP